jgi:hypothetical protein
MNQILNEIMNAKMMTMEQLELLMRECKTTNSFMFIRCLHARDQSIFKCKYVKYFNTILGNGNTSLWGALCCGNIPLKYWDYLMEHCTRFNLFRKRYFIYRTSYWGEHLGNINQSDFKHTSNYWCKIKEYGHADRRPIHLCVDQDGIKIHDVVRESSWVNTNIVYWNNCVSI